MAIPDILGTIQKILRIGLSSSTGASTLRFSNSSGNLDVVGNPTANRTITIPNTSGTIALTSDLIAISALSEGYDVFLLAGQSNCEGWSTGLDTLVDFSNPLILQYPGAGANERRLILASEPLLHRTVNGRPAQIGFGLTFAREYSRVTRRGVILIPTALGGTGFQDNRWNPGNDLFNYAVTNTLQVLALDPNNSLRGILWHQGEQDVSTTAAVFRPRLEAMITAFRTQLSSPNLPFLLAGMVPEWVNGANDRGVIQDVLLNTPSRIANTAFISVAGLLGTGGDIIHFSSASQRILGVRYFNAFRARFMPNPAVIPPLPVPLIQYLFDGNFTNTGSGAQPTNNGVTIITDGIRGQVAQFAGNVNQDFYLLTNVTLPAQYTKAAWVRTTEATSTFKNILSDLNSATNLHHALFIHPDFKYSGGYLAGSYTNVKDPSISELNTWVHIAATQSATQLKLFKNGTLVAIANATYPGGGVIFCGNLSPTGENWVGQMDKVQVWGSALSDAQIQVLFQQG